MTKILALYLPQFHETPENNKWWGKGFTEWTNTKKALPLFNNHYQPRIPLNKYYYDLAEPDVMQKHAAMAKAYGIHGFCFYHYWFNGKQMLHKPVEDLLNRAEIDIPYCLSWANDSWNRAWDGEEKEILMQQEYGDEANWQNHLNYLMPFFNDKRYIAIDNKPVFFIYRTIGFARMNELIKYWDIKLKAAGFNGIHVVETINSFQLEPFCKDSCGVYTFEPMLTLRKKINLANKIKGQLRNRLNLNILFKDKYDRVWNEVLENAKNIQFKGKQMYRGAFVDWDNTPRKGKRGLVINGASPERFGKYCNALMKISSASNANFLIINAWNEWAEGCYLEPDEKFKYGYLDEIRKIAFGVSKQNSL